MNNKYTITAGAPLLRPGLTIRTTCSEKYVVDVTQVLMNMVRDINHPTPSVPTVTAATGEVRIGV